LKIAFFGLPLAAVLLARDGHEIVYGGACRRGPGWRRLAYRIAPGRAELQPDVEAAKTVRRIDDAKPELIVSWFWTTRLPAALLRIAPALGVHPALLPRHRGADPYFWAIDAGDEVTGVTVHRLEREYDTGPILAQREVRLESRWNAWQLARALDRPSLALLRQVVDAYARGQPPAGVPQDDQAATDAPEPSDEELAVRWAWPSERIERRVRAAAPWPGAWTEIGSHIVTLVRVASTPHYPRALAPGEACVREDGVAVVRTGDSAVELVEGRDEDEMPLDVVGMARLVSVERKARG
jgi:methionyl-tRNA formyltransferase